MHNEHNTGVSHELADALQMKTSIYNGWIVISTANIEWREEKQKLGNKNKKKKRTCFFNLTFNIFIIYKQALCLYSCN